MSTMQDHGPNVVNAPSQDDYDCSGRVNIQFKESKVFEEIYKLFKKPINLPSTGNIYLLRILDHFYLDSQEHKNGMTHLKNEKCILKNTNLLRALSISMVTRTERAIVMEWGSEKTEQSTPVNLEASWWQARW